MIWLKADRDQLSAQSFVGDVDADGGVAIDRALVLANTAADTALAQDVGEL